MKRSFWFEWARGQRSNSIANAISKWGRSCASLKCHRNKTGASGGKNRSLMNSPQLIRRKRTGISACPHQGSAEVRQLRPRWQRKTNFLSDSEVTKSFCSRGCGVASCSRGERQLPVQSVSGEEHLEGGDPQDVRGSVESVVLTVEAATAASLSVCAELLRGSGSEGVMRMKRWNVSERQSERKVNPAAWECFLWLGFKCSWNVEQQRL